MFKSKYWTQCTVLSTCIRLFIVTGACVSAEHARANVVLDSRSIWARKPLFYANLATLVASNKLFARSSPFMGGTERDPYTSEERAVPLHSLSVLFVARGVVNTNKCLLLIKPVATDKYLLNVMDPPTNSLRGIRSDLESLREKKATYFLCKKINATQSKQQMTFLYLCSIRRDDRSLLKLQRGLLRIDFTLFGTRRKTKR